MAGSGRVLLDDGTLLEHEPASVRGVRLLRSGQRVRVRLDHLDRVTAVTHVSLPW